MALPSPWSLHCSSVARQLDEVAMRSAAIEAWFHHLPNLGGESSGELGSPGLGRWKNLLSLMQLGLNERAIKTWATYSATWRIISRCSQGAMILVAAHVLNTNRGCDLCRNYRIGWIWSKWTSVCRLWVSSVSLCQRMETWSKLEDCHPFPLDAIDFGGLLTWKHRFWKWTFLTNWTEETNVICRRKPGINKESPHARPYASGTLGFRTKAC